MYNTNLSGFLFEGKWKILPNNEKINKEFSSLDSCLVGIRTGDFGEKLNIEFSDKVISLDISANMKSVHLDYIEYMESEKIVVHSYKFGMITLIKLINSTLTHLLKGFNNIC